MSQRIPGVSDDEAQGLVKEIFDASNELLGRTANLVRILAHSPQLAKWFLGFVVAVRQPNAGAVSDARPAQPSHSQDFDPKRLQILNRT
jgi:hypothetical protein